MTQRHVGNLGGAKSVVSMRKERLCSVKIRELNATPLPNSRLRAPYSLMVKGKLILHSHDSMPI